MALASARLFGPAHSARVWTPGVVSVFEAEEERETPMLQPSPKWLDSGNNAWQLAAATFVGLQSIPGLAVLYAGYVKKKWAINSAFMCFYAFASVLVVWILFDYN